MVFDAARTVVYDLVTYNLCACRPNFAVIQERYAAVNVLGDLVASDNDCAVIGTRYAIP